MILSGGVTDEPASDGCGSTDQKNVRQVYSLLVFPVALFGMAESDDINKYSEVVKDIVHPKLKNRSSFINLHFSNIIFCVSEDSEYIKSFGWTIPLKMS